jgi:hypothetical protein
MIVNIAVGQNYKEELSERETEDKVTLKEERQRKRDNQSSGG